MTFSVSSLYQWPRHSTPKARAIVLGIINASKTPLPTKDIYKLAVKPVRPNTTAPYPGQEIRSMRYLKKVVLRDLAAQHHVEKVRTKGPSFTAWLWQPKAPHVQASPVPSAEPAAQTTTTTTIPALTPAAVGVGEDWSHLNKRRQRARKAKVERDLRWMGEVQKRQRKAVVQA